jgi:hypothetical protein
MSSIDDDALLAPSPQRSNAARSYTIAIIATVIIAIILVAVLAYYFFVYLPGRPVKATPPCQSDADCATPLVCDTTNGLCRRMQGDTCSQDSDCITGTSCSTGVCRGDFGTACTNDASCVPPGKCGTLTTCTTVDQPCPNGVSDCTMPGLDSTMAKCFLATGSACASDADCSSPVTCDLSTNLCSIALCGLAPGQLCNTSTDCTFDEVCDSFVKPNSECRLQPRRPCTSTTQCEQGATCSTTCSNRPCTQDSDCFSSEFCAEKNCISQVCTQDSDCTTALGANWNCVLDSTSVGRCVSNGTDCPNSCDDIQQSCAGSICQNPVGSLCQSSIECATGFCDQTLPTPTCLIPCQTAAECPSGQSCTAGVCG